MAMNKIEFINSVTPVSATTFNEFQNNIENFGNEHISFVDEQELTEEQKAQAKSNLGISESGLKIYSIEEQIIGIWTNGKPVYEKTIITNIGNVNNELHSLNIDEIIDFYGRARSKYDNEWTIPSTFSDGGYNIYSNYGFNDQKLSIEFGSFYESNGSCKVMIKYTKTTDEATIDVNAINTTSLEE